MAGSRGGRRGSVVRAGRVGIVAILMACVTVIALVSTADATPREDRATQLIWMQTGQSATALPATGRALSRGAWPIRAARSANGLLRTWYQASGHDVRLISELRSGQSSAGFPELVPDGFSLSVRPGGTVAVLDPEGRAVSVIEQPWAVDAHGRSLPTHYVVEGRTLRQVVETEAAEYPIVIDPWVKAGWWYYTPVYYIELSWSETWRLKLALAKDVSSAPGLLCTFVPTPVGKVGCGATFLAFKSDVKATVNAAVSAKKCYKARVPATGGAAGLAAYDSYYKTCIK